MMGMLMSSRMTSGRQPSGPAESRRERAAAPLGAVLTSKPSSARTSRRTARMADSSSMHRTRPTAVERVTRCDPTLLRPGEAAVAPALSVARQAFATSTYSTRVEGARRGRFPPYEGGETPPYGRSVIRRGVRQGPEGNVIMLHHRHHGTAERRSGLAAEEGVHLGDERGCDRAGVGLALIQQTQLLVDQRLHVRPLGSGRPAAQVVLAAREELVPLARQL